ncbi:uncharacterized protein KY384_001598 [Bacidia gigantensis]|uniref:uncharacterized protein n=1 Tax=Bacidia gigantensis TaxID=2732470 RepID=UPI001D0594E3|nr:uncharacterized protein KY384_001598 [Bacidia gigantensis]KAG8533857.1 hypothetical protein KY384_001598 [Bacidia gigantensis]
MLRERPSEAGPGLMDLPIPGHPTGVTNFTLDGSKVSKTVILFSKDRIFSFSPKSILPFVFRPEGPLNSGASGQVFKVKVRKGHASGYTIDLWCALKRIPKFDDDSWDGLEREITTLRRRQHPGIISLLGCYLVDGDESSSYVRSVNLLFPLVDLALKHWMSLDQCPVNLKALDLRAFMYDKIYSLAETLAYIHRDVDNEIACHHDLKPENILVDGKEFLICDFGLSRLGEVADGSGTHGKLGLGTPTYQPPEYWRNDGQRNQIQHGRAFDVWALGCVILELLTVLIHGWGGGGRVLRHFEDRRRQSRPRILLKDIEGKPKADKSFHHHMDAVQEWISELR